MSNKNFVVHNGLTVGPLTIDAATGDIITSGNLTLSGGGSISVSNVSTSSLSLADTSVTIQEGVPGSSVYITIDGNVEHTVDSVGVNISEGSTYRIAGNVIANATALGDKIVSSNLTTLGNLISVNASGNIQTIASVIAGGGLYGNIRNPIQTDITAVGNLSSLSSSGTIQTTGQLVGNTVTGRLLTNAQPNITSIGTLSSLAVSGYITLGSGSATGVMTTNGAYDLKLTTYLAGVSNPSITIVQGDDGNIDIKPVGVGLVTAQGPLLVGTNSGGADVTSFGAYDLTLSTNNRNLGRAYVKLNSAADGNIDFGLNGTGTINVPKITFSDGTTQQTAGLAASIAATQADATALAIALG